MLVKVTAQVLKDGPCPFGWLCHVACQVPDSILGLAMASIPEPLGDASGSSGLVPEAPRVSARVGDGVPSKERKGLRLSAVTIG